MKTFTIYLFRHGITKGNLNAQYIGRTDYPLTMDSISELRNIKAKYHYPHVQAVFTSPLKRCTESADIMFPKNNPIVINEWWTVSSKRRRKPALSSATPVCS